MFGERLNSLRKKKGISAREMAMQLEITIRNYRRYESGDTSPTVEKLVQIADILDVSTYYLLCRDEFIEKQASLTEKS